MGGSNFFRDAELDVLSQFVDDWRKLKADPDKRKHIKGQKKPMNEFIDKICDIFFGQFADRDPYQTDPGPKTLTHEQMKVFPKTLRQWLNNQTKDTPTVNRRQANRAKRSNKTARHLAQSKFSARIETQAKVLAAENPGMHILKARNLATTVCIQQLQTECSAEWNELEQLALGIRTASDKDHTEQSPEVLQSILTLFPKQLYKDTEHWSRTMGVLMYTVLVLATPDDPALKSFVVSSPRLHEFEDCPAGEEVRDTIVGWIRDNLGNSADQPDGPPPTVYPNKGNLKPMMPIADHPEQCDRVMLRGWIRLYLTYIWKWLGGRGPVPWKRIAKAGSLEYVAANCLPAGVEGLSDPHYWRRDEILAWYRHLLAGQQGRLSLDKMFCFLRVDNSDGSVAFRYDTLPTERPFASTLSWGPDEKLYAIHLAKQATSNEKSKDFNGLPLARLALIYTPLDEDLVEVLSNVNESKIPLGRLCRLLLKCESLGPIHTIDPLLFERLNAHLPSRLPQTLFSDFATNDWVKEDFFDEEAIEWAELSLATLLAWLKSPLNPFWHPQTSTWRGGPNGVRWIVALISHLNTSFTAIDAGDNVPLGIQRHMNDREHKRNWRLLSQATDWLITSLEACISKLAETFHARSEAWKEEVISQYLNQQVTGDDDQSPSRPVTNGVPQNVAELRQIHEMLTRTDADKTLGNDCEEEFVPRRTTRRTQRRARIESPVDSDTSTESNVSANELPGPRPEASLAKSNKDDDSYGEDKEASSGDSEYEEDDVLDRDNWDAGVVAFAEASFRIPDASETQSVYSDRGMTSVQHAEVLADLTTTVEPSPEDVSDSPQPTADPPTTLLTERAESPDHTEHTSQEPPAEPEILEAPSLRRSPRKLSLNSRAMGAINSSRKGNYRR